MKLRTQIPLKAAKNQIDYTSRLLLLGSCFSKNIGKKFDYFKFQSLQNPFGILFHPEAIEKLISKSIEEETFSEKDVFFHNERWHCFDAHSDLSDPFKERLIEGLTNGLKQTNKQIVHATHIIITLGTAWVYRNIKFNRIVSNCHKVPQAEFKKELLSIDEILYCLRNIIDKIASVNKDTQVIFTISPVRHLKDGFVENQRSKAILITAVQELISTPSYAGRWAEAYFPSYEIMIDELRDYRFYEADLVHPNQLAMAYIWEKFKEVWISENVDDTMQKVDEIRKGLLHRPFNPDSEQHHNFLKSLEAKITYLQQEHPQIKF